jgi:tetratricopeptide (TPR) repeat protein
MKSKDYPAAVDLYSRATLAAPGSYAAYAGLVRAYRARGDTKSALATCRLYLRHDNSTLPAVTMQNIIGEILLAEGRNEEALAIYENASKSYQAGALLGYARTNELLGQMQTAEHYYQAAATRYPQGSAPAQYALFHLRQNDQAGAIEILRQGLSSNRANYYYDALINFYSDSDRLERVLKIIKSVHDGLPEPLFIYDLADRFSRLDEHESAATLHWMLVEQGFEPWLHAAKYVSESDKSGSNADSVEKAFAALGDEMQAQAFFAIDFMREGEFERAFNIYPRVNFQDPWDRAHRALMMTLAWKAGGLADKRRQEIDFPALNIHPWRRQLAEYLQGELDEAMLLAGVSNRAEYTTAHYYIGMQRLIQGKPGEAGDHFRVSLSKGSQDPGEYFLAYRELARLEKKSKDWCCTQNWD